MLENLGEFGWNGVYFINIKMKENDVIVKVEKDERWKIKISYKKLIIYEFIDDIKLKKILKKVYNLVIFIFRICYYKWFIWKNND